MRWMIQVQDFDQQNLTRTSEQDSMLQECDEEDNQKRGGNGERNVNEEEQDDEDYEDVDFNPFLKESNSSEASSGLSSEVEDLGADVGRMPSESSVKGSLKKDKDIRNDSHTSENVDHGEEIVSERAVSSEEVSPSGPRITATSDTKLVLNNQSETGLLCDKANVITTPTSVNNATIPKPSVDVDSEGAICMRTRTHYSLASFTLDELETFLEETEGDDNLHNVDDEVEYRKFLAAVMGGDDSQNLHENENADDEDDADFVLELEGALESEEDEIEERHKSRRSRCRKNYIEHGNRISIERPLRPLLPFASLGSLSSFDGKNLAPSSTQPNMIHASSGFTTRQIGQLHCLIHEHVQLLVQVFSVCIIDRSQKHVSAEVKKLILEMLRIREQALAHRTLSYPSICFLPPYVQPSVRDDLHKTLQPNGTNRSVQGDAHSKIDHGLQSKTIPSQNLQCTSWVPYVCGPVLSVMDVAPLRLVGSYIDEVSSSVKALQNYRIEHGSDTPCQNEPLFPLHNSSCSAESDSQRYVENMPPRAVGAVLSSSTTQMPKKTMAATLLEKAKSLPVALVPKEIAELAQRFWSFFNPALYPHKPPPAPLAKRVLFTDSEDELLALGLMEYNNNWNAIQQRFLPCKTTHQIFVRQKNRASSKAPENPIKAVWRMKKSPLTTEEKARIEMVLDLKGYKLGWPSICRFSAPYRDPSLLAKQWRIACGTPKSYKSNATKRAQRRVSYELRTKASKEFSSTRRSSFEKEGDISDNPVDDTNHLDDRMDKEYVHEAFLADWNPENNTSCPTNLSSQEGCQSRKKVDYFASMGIQTPWVSQAPSQRLFDSQVVMRPYRARRQYSSRLVKLAPNLPPVNLPPSVRVMSQAAFRNSQEKHGDMAAENGRLNASSTTKVETCHSIKSGQSVKSNDVNQHKEHFNVSKKFVVDRGCSDVQMHPLLFQSPREVHLPYYPLTCDSSPSSLFSGKQPHLSLSLFHNPLHLVNFLSNSSKLPDKDVSGDFHPLLQRTDEVDSDKVNELDLDTHLNLTPEKQLVLSGDAARSLSTPSMEAINSKLESSGRKMVDCCRIREREVADESLAGIVMEQEELSDSDKEFGENVEFECEEIADSEGDDSESDSDPFVDVSPLNLNICPVTPQSNTSTSTSKESAKQGNGRTHKRSNDASQSETLPANSRKRSRK